MSMALAPPVIPPHLRADPNYDSDMNTIPDPRTPSPLSGHPAQALSRTDSGSEEGAIQNEVSVLTTKLINAMNHQTNLDDSLQQTRHELEQAMEKLKTLEAENKRHKVSVQEGVLIKREDVEKTDTKLRNDLAEERERRIASEKTKDKIEKELEELSANLFTQANNVRQNTKEKNQRDMDELKTQSDRTASHLRAQLREAEDLVKQHQSQLTDLKTVLQSISESGSPSQSSPTTPHATPAPPTPTIRQPDFDAAKHATFKPAIISQASVTPSTALTLPDLLQPVLRTDLHSYDDFSTLLRTSRTLPPTSLPSPPPQPSSVSAPASRASSGNYTAMAHAISLAHPISPPSPTTGSSPTLHPSNPDTLAPGSQLHHQLLTSTLKDSKFYKRVLTEDIDPTLRLDLAPGLSFFARRTVMAALAAGTLVFLPRNHGPVHPCALCGENRKVVTGADKRGGGYVDEAYARRHCFRVSEEGERTKYPLCGYCVARVRAAAELVAFLRRGVGGHLTGGTQGAEDREKEKEVTGRLWEECVRLRERMFWARIGGGVVPKIEVDGEGKAEGRLDEAETRDMTLRVSSESARTGNTVGSGEALDSVVEDRAVEEKGEREDREREQHQKDDVSSGSVSPSFGTPDDEKENEPVSPLEERRATDVKLPGAFAG
ncbi:hypothetical protein P152DRAFT_402461 [Eremomyces bilateralis CBS 781.70]|uniref:GDP/GTP exchange factor Sec2 N-terminal domain-containing protein n=1 Tax=Eremomyces bilateralis CBS 781.70 TaxID=1392243 RepID=A0A6G1FWA2_9PEZI|nr:uncharacterized protein P152DRAFT_402461 [Eremomyces bilateralis CBS 781.70]KAF1809972.1 hypothetical protein P152DRAFT_402461 [Eremomyces bilateralis CBS 781.70]